MLPQRYKADIQLSIGFIRRRKDYTRPVLPPVFGPTVGLTYLPAIGLTYDWIGVVNSDEYIFPCYTRT